MLHNSKQNQKFNKSFLEYASADKVMLYVLFFSDSRKREKEEYKQLKANLNHFYIRYCNKPLRKVKKSMANSFKLTGNLQDLKSKTGSIPLLKVESSNIKGIGFRNNLLYVAFNTGAVYHYEKVPQQLIVDFLKANSKGKYFNIFIRKGGYAYKKVGNI